MVDVEFAAPYNRGRATLSYPGAGARIPFLVDAGMTHTACCCRGHFTAFGLVWNLTFQEMFLVPVFFSRPLNRLAEPLFLFIVVPAVSLLVQACLLASRFSGVLVRIFSVC